MTASWVIRNASRTVLPSASGRYGVAGGDREKTTGRPETDLPDPTAEDPHEKLIGIPAGSGDDGMTVRFRPFPPYGSVP